MNGSFPLGGAHNPHLGALSLDDPADHPLGHPAASSLEAALAHHGVSRRAFLGYCGFLAGVLALPRVPFAARIAEGLAAPTRLPVLWLNGQDCNGNIEGFLRATKPTPSQLILDQLSVDYVELLMAASGTAAEASLADTISGGRHVVVVEGSIPTAASGAYCCVGGKAFVDVVRQASAKAKAVIAVGACAVDGGLPAARGGVTGATGVKAILGTQTPVIMLPGCPMNVENLTATLVHYMTLGRWPELDAEGRPLFAYGATIHERCPRLSHFREGRFVRAWGDEGHQKGWCLRQMGCQGPGTKANCPTVQFNSGTSWPVGAGAVCAGCTNRNFWDVPGGFFLPRPTQRRVRKRLRKGWEKR